MEKHGFQLWLPKNGAATLRPPKDPLEGGVLRRQRQPQATATKTDSGLNRELDPVVRRAYLALKPSGKYKNESNRQRSACCP